MEHNKVAQLYRQELTRRGLDPVQWDGPGYRFATRYNGLVSDVIFYINQDIDSQLGTYPEQYTVKLVYQRPDGFFTSHTELVELRVVHGLNEKNNHDLAAAEASRRFPGCRIIRVTYH